MEDGWLQVKVPLPYSLKWVNAYLLPDKEGWTIIDPGLRTEEIEAFWISLLAERAIEWQDIKSIVITHHHPDHYGLAGWFQDRTGAKVWMSQVAMDNARRLWDEHETFSDELTEAFIQHGLAEELVGDMSVHMSGFSERVSPHPSNVQLLRLNEEFHMGSTKWVIYGGEGHAPGHLIFYDPVNRRLLCGDQVLPDISPNIGWMPDGDPDPLGSFLKSLQELWHLDVEMVYPGHRDPFPQYRQRVEGLIEHHERRLLKMTELIGEDEKSAFEVCELMFGVRLRSNIHNLRFALAETIAHLVQLEKRGMVKRVEGESSNGKSIIVYRR
nr:MBL fold metallo-hydrolase [Cohnella sp. WQ 127256]